MESSCDMTGTHVRGHGKTPRFPAFPGGEDLASVVRAAGNTAAIYGLRYYEKAITETALALALFVRRQYSIVIERLFAKLEKIGTIVRNLKTLKTRRQTRP